MEYFPTPTMSSIKNTTVHCVAWLFWFERFLDHKTLLETLKFPFSLRNSQKQMFDMKVKTQTL